MAAIIDLSKPIIYQKDDPWFMRVKIRHKPHWLSSVLIRGLGLPFRLFPPGFKGWADDTIVHMGVHSTTHLDAPWHYTPTLNGRRARTIDEIPLDWCYGPGIVVNMTHKEDFDPITVADIQEDLEKSGATITPGTIVLIRTDRDRLMGTTEFAARGTGISAAATEWLIDQGVRVMGIDQWGWDLPFKAQIAKAKRENNREAFWEAHRVGCRKEYCHIEQLTNLKALPPCGFKVAVFPLRIVGASAAPVRVVAIIE